MEKKQYEQLLEVFEADIERLPPYFNFLYTSIRDENQKDKSLYFCSTIHQTKQHMARRFYKSAPIVF